jgi:D-alanyl-D-alanine carboxypeptidase/D-alanyl-D-alanine-endopeptidase (penicillin-binding protein 4)
VTVDNPGEVFLAVLAEVLREQGIEVEGAVRLVTADEAFPHLTPLLEHHSGLLAAIQVANKRSQNFYAEQILKTLGREMTGEGSFRRGAEVVTTFLEKQGFKPEQYRLRDGSGLSRENQLSAHFLTDLLVVMAHSPVADPYRESLAEAGVDGSMRNRLRDVNTSAKVFGKTGSLATVRALSGYVQSESGELLAYSFLMNGPGAGTWRARSVQDEALKLLADR